MTSLTVALIAISVMTLLAVVLAATALCQGRALKRSLEKLPAIDGKEMAADLQSLRAGLDGLAAQIHAVQEHPAPTVLAGPPRGGLNLAKRSQALRLHRHGNSPSEIASTLELPQQEVELLLKVHRMILHNI